MMTTIHNSSEVRNQVGVSQNIQGSLYTGDVHYSSHYHSTTDPRSDEERLNLIHNDILSSLAFPKMLDRRSEVEHPHSNTCRWILNLKDYIDWTTEPCGLLWIKGKPGAGKSTVMSFLYDIRQEYQSPEDGIQLNFFFSARGTDLQRSHLGMLRSLLNQLFQQDMNIRPIVVEEYNAKSSAYGGVMGDNRGWEWHIRELEVLLTKAILSSSQRQRLEIFIDALDEAGETVARKIAQFFHTINDQTTEARTLDTRTSVRICISSRHYPIASSIQGTEILVEHHNRIDIQKFVHDHLNLASRSLEHSDERDWLELENDVVVKSQNIFQWVRLVVPLLEKCLDEAEPMSDTRKLLDQLPEELGDVYKYIVQNIISARHRNQSYCLFRWVCLAERPLSLVEMHYALESVDIIPPPSSMVSKHQSVAATKKSAQKLQTRIKALSGGLIEVVTHVKDMDKLGKYNRGMGHVQIIHQSVNDFLTQEGLLLLDTLQKSGSSLLEERNSSRQDDIVTKCQAWLYRACLNYLALNATAIEAVISEQVSPASDAAVYGGVDGDDNDWLFLKYFPLAHYACYHVLDHASKAGAHREIGLEAEIQFLTKILPVWSTVHELFRGISSRRLPHPQTHVIHIAAFANLSDMLGKLLSDKSNLDKQTEYDYTALHFASLRGHLRVAEVLIEAGAEVNAKTIDGQTPFVIAAEHNHISLLTYLLEKETQGNTLADNLERALHEACAKGQGTAVEILIQAGADVNNVGGRWGPPLRAAVERNGTAKVVQMLIDNGADVNARLSPPGVRESEKNLLERARWRTDPEGRKIVAFLRTILPQVVATVYS